jgi:lipopolysaccharide transport system permease protein
MAAYSVSPPIALVVLPVWILAAIAAALGVGLWLSALNVLYRDVRYALNFLTQVWLFASPVAFPSTIIHGAWQYVYALNPMVVVIDGFRWSLLGAPAPRAVDLISLAMIVLISVTGLVYFSNVERRLADRI